MKSSHFTAGFLAGLFAVAWVAVGYLGASPLALAMTVLIALVYGVGGTELFRFHRETVVLDQALATVPDDLAEPGPWLGRLPPALQSPVRLRIEGERAPLPGPALAPYLVGLLVLLGMLGTFLGMVSTLKGAVLALEGATDVQTIRASLAAPVQGLGVAFGTSVAGVAASAVLGLLSSLCRRARLASVQRLDSLVATRLRRFSRAHQRESALAALERQADALPAVVEALQALTGRMDQQHQALQDRLLAEQGRFYQEAEGAYARLADSVDRALQARLAESLRQAGESLAPQIAGALSAVTAESAALHGHLTAAVDRHLDGVTQRLAANADATLGAWNAALDRQQQHSLAVSEELRRALDAAARGLDERGTALVTGLEAAHGAQRAEWGATLATLTDQVAARQADWADRLEAQADGLARRLATAVTEVTESWSEARHRQEQAALALLDGLEGALAAAGAGFAERSAALLEALQASAEAAQTEQAARQTRHFAAQAEAMTGLATALRAAWDEAGARGLAQQEQICATLADTASALTGTTQAEAQRLLAEIRALLEQAGAAPRAAAEVLEALRAQQVTAQARDDEAVAERRRLADGLSAALEGLTHSAGAQRQAVEDLVAATTLQLDAAGQRFATTVAAESERVSCAAGQIAEGALEVASLGEAFGHAVGRYGEANEQLMVALARIEGALEKTLTRSDDQLAYYVAQARELIELTLQSQGQIVEGLQRRGARPALAGEA